MMKKRKVHQIDPSTKEVIDTFDSIAQAERAVSCSSGGINKALSLNIKCKGYYWAYANGVSQDSNPAVATTMQDNTKVDLSDIYVTEEQLHARHDMLYKLKKELSSIPEGAYIEESRLLKKIGIAGRPGYRAAANSPEIDQYKGKVDNIVYYGHPSSIEKNKMKGLLT